MTWESWQDFFAMGGYAPYVWGAYGVMIGLIATEIILLRLRRRSVLGYLGGLAGRASEERKES